MRKLLLTSIILILAAAAMAQQKNTINLIDSKTGHGFKLNGQDVSVVINGVFQQKFSTLRADSTIIYPNTNIIDCYGHVVITQGDTLHVYADQLNYDDKTKIAILTNHVRMVDKDATLTTNLFNYNTATKYGTYVNGGKLVNKDNVLTSTNGYYDANTRDAYFRYNVVTTSPDALIKTDTMRYNSGSRITYFYGPTHIYGKKDKDTLYTENGTYNTKTEQAFFGKKNRYSQGTKSLKGDSLFYDKLKGYGKAIKNITFEDKEQKMILKGNLGEYFKAEDKAVITQKPYAILITEKSDSTKAVGSTQSAAGSKKTGEVAPGDSIIHAVVKTNLPKTLPTAKADSMAKAIAKNPAVKNAMPLVKDVKAADVNKAIDAVKKLSPGKADSLAKAIAKNPAVKNTVPLANNIKPADVNKALNAAKNLPPVSDKAVTNAIKNVNTALADTAKKNAKPVMAPKDSVKKSKTDTMYIGADTLETQVLTYKALKDLQEKRRLAGIRDTSIKPRKPFVPYTAKTMPKFLSADMPALIFEKPDYINRPLFPKPAPDTTQKKVAADAKKPAADGKAQANAKAATDKKPDAKPGVKLPVDKKKLQADSILKAKLHADSLKMAPKLSDSSRIRILSAHHNVKIFKSDLQGKADSLFYSSSDSVIRSYIKPMYWSQGAQISGDTINLAMKNKKADNMDIYPSAFIVHIEKSDSAFFNQVAGKRMRVFFKDSKISRATVNGNAEAIYFNRKKDKVTELTHSMASRIEVNMKNGEVTTAAFILKPEHHAINIKQAKDDDKILKGFIWKPKERPASKQDVINPKKPQPDEKDQPKKSAPGKASAKGAPVKGSPAKTPPIAGDSVKVAAPAAKEALVPSTGKSTATKTDSVKKVPVPLKRDSTAAKKDTAKKAQ
ncbi:hypothetical protein HQ865_21990 [Mucilaginibacter mali]|uniref:Organic solvent tolerance-like N-terminal domain-containing protein n=1 Tax=Mucilaginibacter mali TaxID=2740462 RepID=A0A7D4UGU6_9SPHI|nr:OstA-like protein [Mucilaginibacter mali]QKJ32316.1 hypothetical protein HQ865_21990 [Mucilaginibacter mali]